MTSTKMPFCETDSLKNANRVDKGTGEDLWRDNWTGEVGTGQQVAQVCDRGMLVAPFTGTRNCYRLHSSSSSQVGAVCSLRKQLPSGLT
jgi:hypothetical protein